LKIAFGLLVLLVSVLAVECPVDWTRGRLLTSPEAPHSCLKAFQPFNAAPEAIIGDPGSLQNLICAPERAGSNITALTNLQHSTGQQTGGHFAGKNAFGLIVLLASGLAIASAGAVSPSCHATPGIGWRSPATRITEARIPPVVLARTACGTGNARSNITAPSKQRYSTSQQTGGYFAG